MRGKFLRVGKRAGFTLIELLLVIVILGILAVLGLGSYTSTLRKSRDARRKSDLRNIAVALDAYYSDNNRYPLGSASGKIYGCAEIGQTADQECSWGSKFGDPKGTIYMQILPSDPTTIQQYYYVSASGTQFQLYAYLENSQDQSINSSVVSKGLDCGSAGTVICNYGVASQNAVP